MADQDVHCDSCGRRIPAGSLEPADVAHYCSSECRSRGVGDLDRTLEARILELLALRDPGKTICVSEAARAVSEDDWRDLMEPARSAARRLVVSGDVVITQGGQVVDPSTARGPIRVRRLR
ncbi:MAG: DUF3253 domain-containing protein [Aeromicrobium sp.]